MAERQGLGKSLKSQTKYGTTSKLMCSNESFIKHRLLHGETLQGIALKYGCTLENLRRVNNMWTNDSLFLRDYILIPISKSPLHETNPLLVNGAVSSAPQPPGGGATNVTPDSGEEEVVTRKEIQNSLRLSRSSSCRSVGSEPASLSSSLSFTSSSTSDAPSGGVPSGKDFLSRFDSTLAQIKNNVQRLETSSNFPEDTTNPLSLLPPRRGSGRLGNSSINHNGGACAHPDLAAEPGLMFRSASSGALTSRRQCHVRSSLEKLEQAQEDLFQL